jgi:hypothetical protein
MAEALAHCARRHGASWLQGQRPTAAGGIPAAVLIVPAVVVVPVAHPLALLFLEPDFDLKSHVPWKDMGLRPLFQYQKGREDRSSHP